MARYATLHPLQMNMVDMEKTDAFLARSIVSTFGGSPEEAANKGSQLHQRIQLLQEEWGLYAVALIRQCVFDHPDSNGPEGKVYRVTTMKASFGLVWFGLGLLLASPGRCRKLRVHVDTPGAVVDGVLLLLLGGVMMDFF